ncbi:MAG: NPCBM/NEW2 domain-containing protein [Planctomycetota bacterium]|nr:NPCBM/NEW2 domain-containing protein [Planctomycetota bacterium]
MSSVHVTAYLAAAILVQSGSGPGMHATRQTLTVSELPFDSRLVTFLPGHQIELKHGDKTRVLPLNDLISWGSYTDQNRQPHVYLRDGGVLTAEIMRITPTQVSLYSRVFTEVQIPRSLIRAIVFVPRANALARDRFRKQILSYHSNQDTVHFTNGDTLRGAYIATSNPRAANLADHIGFQAERRRTPFSIPLPRLNALIFRSQTQRDLRIETKQQTPSRYSLGFADGTLIHVDAIMSNQTQVQLHVNRELTLSAATSTFHRELTQLQTYTPRVTFVSDLEPTSYKHIPFLRQSWPQGTDENALGGRLRCAGTVHAKGIGMHSASRVTYQIDQKFRWFQAELAIDQAAANRGSVIFRVFLQRDGAWAATYTSPVIRGTTRPLAIKIEVARADAIALLVEFADRGDERDYANWLNARLSN